MLVAELGERRFTYAGGPKQQDACKRLFAEPGAAKGLLEEVRDVGNHFGLSDEMRRQKLPQRAEALNQGGRD